MSKVFLKTYQHVIAHYYQNWITFWVKYQTTINQQLMAQYAFYAFLEYLRSSVDQDSLSVVRVKCLMTTLTNIKIYATKVENMEVSAHEFAYLRLCTLFSPSKCHDESIFQFTCHYKNVIIYIHCRSAI